MEATLIAEAIKIWGVPGGVLIFVLATIYKNMGRSDSNGSALDDIREIKEHLYDLRSRVSKIEGYLEGKG